MRFRNWFAAAMGRPRAIEGEKTQARAYGVMASTVRPANGGVYFMPVDEILRRNGHRVYKEMVYDEQVRIFLEFKKLLVGGRTWALKPANDTPAAKDAAQFLEWCLNRMGFDGAVKEALTALEFGYAAGEQVFERAYWQGKQVVCLKKIAFRDPEFLLLATDEGGNFTGLLQRSSKGDIQLTPEKVWLFSHNVRFGDVYGTSDLGAAYRSWWAKKFIINFWNVFLERMGQPMMLMKYPTGATDELKQTLTDILKNLASKTEVLVPEGVQAELLEAQRSGTATYEEALKYHDKGIAKALLMASVFGDTQSSSSSGSAGGSSQSSLQLRVLFKMADEVSQFLACSFMEQVARPLIEMNFDGDIDEIMPQFMWHDYGQFEGMKVADTIRLLFAAGILDMDQEDVNYCRSILGLPLRGEGDKPDEVHRPPEMPPAGNPNTPPPSADQGNERAKKGGDTGTPEGQ